MPPKQETVLASFNDEVDAWNEQFEAFNNVMKGEKKASSLLLDHQIKSGISNKKFGCRSYQSQSNKRCF